MEHASTYEPEVGIRQVVGRAAADHAPDARAVRRLPDAAQSQLSLDVRRHPDVLPRRADRDRRRARHALPAERGRRPSTRSSTSAATSTTAGCCATSTPSAPRCSSSPSTSTSSAASTTAPTRRRARCSGSSACLIFARHDGDGLHGLRAALGPDELLGRHRHHQPVLVVERDHPGSRHDDRRVAVGRLFGVRRRRSTASSRFTTCCRSCSPASSSCTSGRCMSPARTTRPASTSRPSRTPCRCFPTRWPRTAVGLFVFLLLFAWFVFYVPDYLGHADNYIEANPLVTPPHIVPEWYFLPFYAILRAIPSKLGGVIAMFSAIVILVFVPWLDSQPRPLGQVSPDLQVVLLAVRHLLPRRSAISAPSRRRASTSSGRASSRSTTSPTSCS